MRLLESQGTGERRAGGTTMSVVAHAAVIAAAIAGTAQARPGAQPVDPPTEIIYVANDPLPPAPRHSGHAAPAPAPGPVVAPSLPSIPLPTEIPVGLPPVDVTMPPLRVEDGVTLGGTATPRRDGAGGFGAGPANGAPDGSGLWDAHTVEVPVVPAADNPVPAYPEMLRTGGIAGRVVAEFVVDSTGRVRVGSLVLVEASHPLFASSVRRAVPGFRFTPARVQGRRVAQRVRVPFEFEMR